MTDGPKTQTVADLASSRQAVDVVIRTGSGDQEIKGAEIAYAKRDWIGVVYLYRGIRHELHLPRESVVEIDRPHTPMSSGQETLTTRRTPRQHT